MLRGLLALDQNQCPADVRPCSGLLDFNLTLVVELVIFVVTALVLWLVLWKPIVEVLERRQAAIDAGQRAAAEAERELQQAETEVQAILDGARSSARDAIAAAGQEARQHAEAARADARRVAERLLENARGEIARERDSASLDLRVQTENLVLAAGERIAGAAIDGPTLRAAVREALSR